MSQYTKFLSHFNGADAATDIIDDAGHIITCKGNAQLDTAQKKFGTASLLLASNDDCIIVPASTDWYFDANWTIDWWIRFNSLPSVVGKTAYFVSQSNLTIHAWWINLSSGSPPRWYYGALDYGVDLFPAFFYNWTPSANTWYHMEYTRSGDTFYYFINGTSLGTKTDASRPTNTYFNNLCIGWGINGWIDEFRISKGIARHTSNFTAPSAEYSINMPPNVPTALSVSDT